MNAEVEAITAEDHRVEGFRATGTAYYRPTEVLQLRQYRVANESSMHGTCTGAFEKLRCKTLRIDAGDDKSCPGKLVISTYANRLSQLERDSTPRVHNNRIPPIIVSDDDAIPCDEQKSMNEFRGSKCEAMMKFHLIIKRAIIDFHNKKCQTMMKLRLMSQIEKTDLHHTKRFTMLKFRLMKKKAMAKSRRTCKISYRNIRFLEKTRNLLLIKNRSNKVKISVRHMANKKHLVNNLFDTGARLNPLRKDFFESERLRAVQAYTRPDLKKATNQSINIVEIITLQLRATEFIVRVFSGILRSLVVPILFKSSLI